MKCNKGFGLISTIIIICVTSIVSAITVGIIITNNYGFSYNELANDSSLNEFLNVYSNILENYYEEIDKDEMIDSAVNAMLNYLDDNYTTYLDKDERESLENLLAGSYQGIGVEISERTIKNVTKDSPAQIAGLQVGDVFEKVDGIDVSSYSVNELTALIKNSGKKSIDIEINRDGEILTFNIKIDTILTSSIETDIIDDNIGYINMKIFSRTLTTQVEDALKDLEERGMQKLIIDLRNNTGGYLDSAEGVASLFLEKGKLIYTLQDKNSEEKYYDKDDKETDYPIVVILNEKSASAAEILAAALKDSYGAILVGEKSYGKGKVQQTYNMDDGSMAKYTSAKWLRPSGECIDGIGLIPDYEAYITYEQDESGENTIKVDGQLDKAIEVITAMQ